MKSRMAETPPPRSISSRRKFGTDLSKKTNNYTKSTTCSTTKHDTTTNTTTNTKAPSSIRKEKNDEKSINKKYNHSSPANRMKLLAPSLSSLSSSVPSKQPPPSMHLTPAPRRVDRLASLSRSTASSKKSITPMSSPSPYSTSRKSTLTSKRTSSSSMQKTKVRDSSISSEYKSIPVTAAHHKQKTIVRESNSRTSSESSSTIPVTALTSRMKLKSSSKNKDDYTIQFQPGSLGMRLGPVIPTKNQGCKIVGFVTINHKDSQAKLCGKISLDDVIVSIDNITVLSKKYDDIVILLKNNCNKVRKITFRNVQDQSYSSPVQNNNIAPKNKVQFKNEKEDIELQKNELSPASFQTAGVDGTTSSPLTTFCTPFSNKVSTYQEEKLNYENLFSPSNIKKISKRKSTPYKKSIEQQPFDISTTSSHTNEDLATTTSQISAEPINEILKRIVSDAILYTLSATSTVKDKLGEALLGKQMKDYQDFIENKKLLNTELNYAMKTLQGDQENIQSLEYYVESFGKDQDDNAEVNNDNCQPNAHEQTAKLPTSKNHFHPFKVKLHKNFVIKCNKYNVKRTHHSAT